MTESYLNTASVELFITHHFTHYTLKFISNLSCCRRTDWHLLQTHSQIITNKWKYTQQGKTHVSRW